MGVLITLNKNKQIHFFGKFLNMLCQSRLLRVPACKALSRIALNRLASSDYSVIGDAENPDQIVEQAKISKTPIYHSRDDFWAKYPPSNPSVAREAWIEDLNSE